METTSRGTKARTAAQAPAKPGLFAPKHEKEFYKALKTYANGDTEAARTLFQSASEKDTGGRALADDLLAGILSASTGRLDEAVSHLEKVVSSEVELPDELMTKYGLTGSGTAPPLTLRRSGSLSGS
jgi:hypothetical protein